ncbi:MAG: MMPL family transporter [Elusimicrobia bacterium]|nr:MMPL family transporter [Candidatus Omnitrophota bacterium]MCG2725016.1 MMPL family transporter [Elusimicrobiota bacterium]
MSIDLFKNLCNKWIDFALRRSRVVLFIYALLIVGGLWSVAHIRLDYMTDSFFDPTTHNFIETKKIEKEFNIGSGEALVVLHADDIFTEKNLRFIDKLTLQFENMKYVEDVISLTTVNDILGEKDNFIVEKLIEEVPSGSDALQDLRKKATTNPLFAKNVISPDGKTAGIIVQVSEVPELLGGEKRIVVENIEKILASGIPAGMEIHLSGGIPLSYYYSEFMAHDMSIFLPLALVLMIATLFIAFRKVKVMAAPAAGTSVSLLFTMSLFYLFDLPLNNVTVVVPPVIMGCIVGDSLHFVMHTLRKRGKDKTLLLASSMRELFIPCFMTSITTFGGFISLVSSDSPAVRQMGAIAGAGMLIGWFVTFTFLPALMMQIKGLGGSLVDEMKVEDSDSGVNRLLSGICDFIIRYSKIIVIAWLALGCAVLPGILNIKVESSLLAQLDSNSQIYKSVVFTEKNLTGIQLLHFSFKTQSENGIKNPAILRQMEKLQRHLETMPEVDKTMSVVDYLKQMNKSFHEEKNEFYVVPETREMVSQYTLLYGEDDLEKLVDSGWSWGLVTARMKERNSAEYIRILAEMRGYVRDNISGPFDIEIVGPTVTEAEGVTTVTNGQIRSLIQSFCIVFGLMFIMFRSFSAGFVSMMPNVIPLMINFGIMGFFGIRLDTATSIISAVTLGIIVDHTIHYVHGFGKNLRKTGNYEFAMRETMMEKGSAMIFTTAILMCSFGVAIFSNFVPIFQFGLLCTGLMITAMIGDMLVIPALAIWFKPRFHGSDAKIVDGRK